MIRSCDASNERDSPEEKVPAPSFSFLRPEDQDSTTWRKRTPVNRLDEKRLFICTEFTLTLRPVEVYTAKQFNTKGNTSMHSDVLETIALSIGKISVRKITIL